MSKMQKYWDLMKSKSGVLYLMGKPGVAKTAIVKAIAKERGLYFIDMRLSEKDEVDLGLYPHVCVEHGVQMVKRLPSEWAVKANQQPSLIFFDELNRSRECVRNAALQILNERRIGESFEFNENVYMVAAGNLGEEDGTSVEEFDSALWNRLILVKHELTIDDWVEGFAEKNVWQYIVSFIKANPENFYRAPTENSKQFATPRSWTFLSDYLKTSFGSLEKIDLKEVVPLLRENGHSFIGNSITSFLRYVEDMSVLSIQDILERFEQVESQVKQCTRSQISEMIHHLKEMGLDKFSKKKVTNLVKFMQLIHEDERVSFLMDGLAKYVKIEEKGNINIDKNFEVVKNAFVDDFKVVKKNFGLLK